MEGDPSRLDLYAPAYQLSWKHVPDTGVGIADILSAGGVPAGIALGRPEDPEEVRRYTFEEWHAFIGAVKNEEFDNLL
jgi:hypothetical protein